MPAEANRWLYETTGRFPRLRPVPAAHPGLPGWEAVVHEAVENEAPAIRAAPGQYGLAPTGPAMVQLVQRCAAAGIPIVLAVRLEDGRQRQPEDTAPELPAAAVRTLIRLDRRARLLVTHAERSFIEEVHFGSTPDEASRIWWDISWVWGPPEDHLQQLLATMGSDRFVFGTGQPLRIPETAVARLDLLELELEARQAIESGNVRSLMSARSLA